MTVTVLEPTVGLEVNLDAELVCHTTYAATPPGMFDQTTQVTPL